MDTTLSMEKNKKQLIREIQERLDWYNFEASEEEFDENEVMALVELLKTLDAGAVVQTPDVDESYERFQQFLEMKWEDAERLAVLRRERVAVSAPEVEIGAEFATGMESKFKMDSATEAEAESKIKVASKRGVESKIGVESKAGAESKIEAALDTRVASKVKGEIETTTDTKPPRKGRMRHTHRYVAAAAVLAVVLVAGGTVGAVNAEKKGGVFQWLFRDDNSSLMVISPNDNENFGYAISTVFYSEEDVPEKYQKYMPDVEEMESLEGYTLKEIEIQEMTQFDWILYKINKEERELMLRIATYHDSVVVQSDQFNHYEYLTSIVLHDQEMELYSKTDDSGETDYIVSFFKNKQQYVIQGKQSLEFLEQVALEYYNTLIK
ncbi:MAG: hypothetical protein NC417_04265 [Candidatus Gastranaerophilales bacterium]|nr:hypothetical protein [Candidatus Gastranaerophilales bacterium]